MNDYLNNLAARSLNSTAALQPRLASLFEPPSGANRLISRQPFRLEILDGEPTSERSELEPAQDMPSADLPVRRYNQTPPPTPVSLQPSKTTSQQAPNQLPFGNLKSNASQAPMPTASQPSVLNFPDQSVPEQPALPSSAISNEPASHQSLAEEQKTQSLPQPVIQQRIIERVVTLAESLPTATPTTRPSTSTRAVTQQNVMQPTEPALKPTESTATPAPPPAISPVVQQRTTERVVTPAESLPTVPPRLEPPPTTIQSSDIVQPQVRPYVKPVAPVLAQPPISEPTPVIQITIGRIEVRATPPSTPPQKQRTAPPVMNLEEYLRHRTKGGS